MSLSGQAQTRSELSLLADPDLLAQRIAQLEAAEESAKGVLTLVGPANEILAIRKQVDQELADAKQAKVDAEVQVRDALAEADKCVESLLVGAEKEAEFIVAAAQARDDDAQVRQSAAQENLAETEREQSRLRSWDQVLSEQESALQVRDQSLNEIESSLLKEKAQLTEIRERLNDFLG